MTLQHIYLMLQREVTSIARGVRCSSFRTTAATCSHTATPQKQERRCDLLRQGETFVPKYPWHRPDRLHALAVPNNLFSYPVASGLRRSAATLAGVIVPPASPVGSLDKNFSHGRCRSEFSSFQVYQGAGGAVTADYRGDVSTPSSSAAVHQTDGGDSTPCGATPVNPRLSLFALSHPSSPRLMWHRGVLELLCSSCRYVVRRWHVPILGVDCNANPRHKQALTSPPPRSRGIPKHLTPYLVGKQAPRHPRWRQDHMVRARATHFYRGRVRRNG